MTIDLEFSHHIDDIKNTLFHQLYNKSWNEKKSIKRIIFIAAQQFSGDVPFGRRAGDRAPEASTAFFLLHRSLQWHGISDWWIRYKSSETGLITFGLR
jgi:hypothetical protein